MADDPTIKYAERTETINGEIELIGSGIEASGIIHPGDVLLLSYDRDCTPTPEQAETLKRGLMQRMPGLSDVMITPFRLEGIYRSE